MYLTHQKQATIRKIQEEQQKVQQLQQKQNAVLANSHNTQFTEEDFHNAFNKLTAAAVKYNKQSPSAGGLQAFECSSMPAHIFREQLKLTFNMKVTIPELFSLVNYFERDDTGEVNCSKFICSFLQIGFIERNQLIRNFQKMQRQKEQLAKKQLWDVDDPSQERNQNNDSNVVNFSFNEADFKTMLTKFLTVCTSYHDNRNSENINRLVVLQQAYLSPLGLKSVLKTVFNMKLSPKEVGAMVSYFDIYGKQQAHVQTFLNTLIQIGFKRKQYKVHYMSILYSMWRSLQCAHDW
jgi:hypothetical protein